MIPGGIIAHYFHDTFLAADSCLEHDVALAYFQLLQKFHFGGLHIEQLIRHAALYRKLKSIRNNLSFNFGPAGCCLFASAAERDLCE